jgi:hypothetical protein
MNVSISQVMIESNSLMLISAIRSSAYDQASGGVMFQEIREVLDLHFTLHGVSHIPCSCNKCAHELARSGLDRTRMIPSFGMLPSQAL